MNYSYYYDQICAVRELSFHVNEGEVVTLIGSNGAGKTTTLRSISGLIRGGGRGGIKYMGKNIENLPPHRISSMGIAQCLEGRQVFPHLSVKENLQICLLYTSREAALKAMTYARKNGTVVVFDIDYRAYTWKNKDEISIYYTAAAAMADIIMGSREEYDLTDGLVYQG